MPIPAVLIRVVSNKKLTDLVYETTFKMIDPTVLEFKAGQHFIFEINSRAVRQLSIASAPQTKDSFQLCIDISPRGPASLFIEGLKAGDQVRCRGPLGRFVLSDEAAKNILFVATGVGIAPLKSMIFDLYNRRAEPEVKKIKQIELYFGVRFSKDIFYFDQFEKLAADWPKFKFFPTLSKPDAAWAGLKGRVTDHLVKNEIAVAQTEAYLCGSGQMIVDVKELLQAKGMPDTQIYFEKFFE